MTTAILDSSNTSSKRTRKGAQPPVKVACLACRAARTRCDGKPICTTCLTKGRDCCYTKSNRGGPRIPRKAAQNQLRSQTCVFPSVINQETDNPPDSYSTSSSYSSDAVYNELVASMVFPGAGLIDLENESDFIFDSIFPDQNQIQALNASRPISSESPVKQWVRKYGSDESILNAYYTYIHCYFPILPPPLSNLEPDDPISQLGAFEPSSPIGLALSAILALIPHPDDPTPKDETSIQCRRNQAQLYAQMSMESLEIESELLSSTTDPSEGLSSEPVPFMRNPFHPCTPVEIESVIAYLVLCIYEYAQRGNIPKMRNRASQAYDAAIRLSLQCTSGDENDQYTEARRRAWWMTYICVLQSSIVSSLPPITSAKWNQFPVRLPALPSDTDAWPYFLEAQQMILLCTQYTVSLKKALETGSGFDMLEVRKSNLDGQIDSIIARYADNNNHSRTANDGCNEEKLAISLRLQAQIKLNSARIKLHRYRAFQDTPIFTKRHCDLSNLSHFDTNSASPCSCGGIISSASPHSYEGSNHSTQSPQSHASSITSNDSMPFGDHKSARICLKAALAISRAFESLPYPNLPSVLSPSIPPFLSSTSSTSAPRTMPAFACCAMQSCYALLTLCYRSKILPPNSDNNPAAQRAKAEIHLGISRVLAALENYSLAFEALRGMTDQVREAWETLKTE